jgi:uncharacterized membrane protein YecN with MAPEG domain
MSIADSILTAIIYIYQNTLLLIFPTEFADYPIATFESAWTAVITNLTTAYSNISFFFPMTLILGLVVAVIGAEILLVSFRGIKYLIATFRGSGT